jgi:hypothetical protein
MAATDSANHIALKSERSPDTELERISLADNVFVIINLPFSWLPVLTATFASVAYEILKLSLSSFRLVTLSTCFIEASMPYRGHIGTASVAWPAESWKATFSFLKHHNRTHKS